MPSKHFAFVSRPIICHVYFSSLQPLPIPRTVWPCIGSWLALSSLKSSIGMIRVFSYVSFFSSYFDTLASFSSRAPSQSRQPR